MRSRRPPPYRLGVRGYILGVRCGLRGLLVCVGSPRLWPWALVPIAIGFALFAGPLWWFGSAFGDALRTRVPTWLGESGAAWTTGAAVTVLAGILAILAYFVVGPFIRIVAAPFLAILSDRVVRERGLPVDPAVAALGPFERYLVVPVRDAIVFLGIRICITAVAAPLLCVPVAGQVLFLAVLVPLEGADRMDVALSSRGVPLPERIRQWRQAPARLPAGPHLRAGRKDRLGYERVLRGFSRARARRSKSWVRCV